ncbi:hypothetical protein [Rhizobium sp. GN54]|uniref:hypothetical protein n=1 Tax=Rhizobium sp. GN54 TaxID=2898150 RepID=UPI001E484770|nr:hypothetical protein [Rhizobium sp. GN54]MCD2183337.1 hypothetical protein [Rhizobium sp. GN54]
MTRKRELPSSTTAETFVPAVSFTGYPDGKTPVQFIAGVESVPVPAGFAQLMRDKGLVSIPEGDL